MIGGLGDEVPQKQKLFSYLSTDSSSFCEFHYSKNLSVVCITKCEKKFDHRLGGAMAPCGPPLDPPLPVITVRVNPKITGKLRQILIVLFYCNKLFISVKLFVIYYYLIYIHFKNNKIMKIKSCKFFNLCLFIFVFFYGDSNGTSNKINFNVLYRSHRRTTRLLSRRLVPTTYYLDYYHNHSHRHHI